MIEPEYYSAWFNLIDQTKNKYGWNMPVYVEQYISAVLANYTDKPDWQPATSWAETLLQIQTAHAAKTLGDQALFAASVFPNLLADRGINSNYFHDIGRMSYNKATEINLALFSAMSLHFSYVTHCIQQVIYYNPQVNWYQQ